MSLRIVIVLAIGASALTTHSTALPLRNKKTARTNRALSMHKTYSLPVLDLRLELCLLCTPFAVITPPFSSHPVLIFIISTVEVERRCRERKPGIVEVS